MHLLAKPEVVKTVEAPANAAFVEFEKALLSHFAKVTGAGEAELRPHIPGLGRNGHPGEWAAFWQQDSLVEDYCRRLDLDLSAFLGKTLREHPAPAFNPTILGTSPADVLMPPISVPLMPVAVRNGEVTIVSWVPGLSRLLVTPLSAALNAFWAAGRITSLWSEPAHLREALRAFGQRIVTRANTGVTAPV